MFKLLNSPFYYPPVESAAPAPAVDKTPPNADANKEDIIDFLKDDEKEVIPLEKPKDKDKKDEKEIEPWDDEQEEQQEEEPDELAEIEAELEEPSPEQLELVTPVRRKEILAKYPSLFKEFPYLEKAYYREQQFTELLPTIEDAKAAVEAKETLDTFGKEVMDGNLETVLRAVKEENPNSFNKIGDNILDSIRNVDEKVFFHIAGNIGKQFIIGMVNEGRRSENQELLAAAQLLNQFIFGSSQFEPPQRLTRQTRPEENEKEQQLTQREQQFTQRQFESARGDLNTKVNNALTNTIDAHIDPNGNMSDYVKRNASRDALDTLGDLLSRDNRFKTLVDKLWDSAFQDGFSSESVGRIRSAYVSRAKALLPAVIKKARNDAMRGLGKRVTIEESENRPDKKGPIPSGRPRSQSSNSGNKKDVPKGMTTLEFLNSD